MNLRIKEVCDQKGISVAELGRMIGLAKSSIHTIIKNGNPTIDTLNNIAKALGVEITELLVPNEDETGTITCPKCGTKFKEV